MCHAKSTAAFVSGLLANKMFSMARNGEYKIQGFPDFSATLEDLRQYQRAPQPTYEVCVSTGEGHLIVRQSLVEFWSKKHSQFEDRLNGLIEAHNKEFNPKGLKRGSEESAGDGEQPQEPPTKRLRLGGTTTSAELEKEHPDRTPKFFHH